MKTLLQTFIIFISMIMIPHIIQASHWGGGEINYKCIGFSQYEVSINLYSDCSGVPITAYPGFQVEYLSSCGNGIIYLPLSTFSEISPVCQAMLGSTICNGGAIPGVIKAIYKDTVTLPNNCTDWEFRFASCCRNNATLNIANPSGTGITLSSKLDNISYLCNSSPRFENSAVAFAQIGQPFVYDPHAVDDDGDELRFRLVSALDLPNIPVFYIGGLTGQQPVFEPFIMDSLTGRFLYTPTVTPGDFIITYQIDEYRNGNWIGSTQREMRIAVGNFGLQNNNPPTSTIGNVTGAVQFGDTLTVCSGQAIDFDFTVTDADPNDTINIIDYDIYNTCPGATFNVTGHNPAVGAFHWTPQTGGIYKVGLIIQDPNCPIVASHQYHEITIIVQNSTAIISQTDQFLCSSPTITLTANGNFASYLWSTGATTSSIAVTTAGVYSVSTTGICGPSSASIEIFDYPEVIINGGNSDTTIIQGDSIQLLATLANGLASDLFFYKDTMHVIPAGGTATIPLVVSGIFPSILDSGSVVDVCLTINQANAEALDLYLVAPNGAMIEMSTNNGSTGNYNNTCFSINASDLISNYSASNIPIDSSFIPQGNWDHLYGSATASLWQIAIRHDSMNGVDGVLTNLSIQFGGGYDHIWTPNTGDVSCDSCPDPIVNPDSTTTYIVQMTDGAGCTSYDTITITVLHPEPIDTIYISVEPDSTRLACASFPSYMGAVASTDLIVLPFYNTFGISPTIYANCIAYTALIDNVVDTLMVAYCDSVGLCDTTVFIFTVGSCVWAGDTDTNQLVNNFDLLPIGLGYGQVDYVRPNADLLFDCEPNRDWTNNTPVTNVNYKHSDCDGNGTINADDTAAIVLNWGQFYVKNNLSSSGTIPLYTEYYQTVEGATIQVPIILGDSINPVDSAYGLAFTINYDPTLVDTNSVSVNFNTSWLGQINTDLIAVSKDFYNQGQIQVGLTRIDHQTRAGFGQIGVIQMTIKDDIIKKSANIHLNTHIDNVRLISDQEIERSTIPVYTYVLILDSTTITNTTTVNELEQLAIYPNPVGSTLYLQSNQSVIEEVALFNIAGQKLLDKSMETKQTTLSVVDLSAGIYLLRIQTNEGIHHKRIVVKR